QVHLGPLVVDLELVASSGTKLLSYDAFETPVSTLSPLGSRVTPNSSQAQPLAGGRGTRRELAERIHELGAPAVVVTGGHGDEPVDHLYDGERHVEISVARYDVRATHGAGCTHSATLAAELAKGRTLEAAATT